MEGRGYVYEKEYATAIKYFDSCLLPQYIKTNLNSSRVINSAQLDKAVCLVKLGDYRAISQIDTLPLDEDDYLMQQFKYNALYEYAKLKGDWKKALMYYEKYKQYSDSSNLLNARGQMFEANQKYSVAERKSPLKTLKIKI